MPYIGRGPLKSGAFRTIDDISGSFNGSTTSFALEVGSASLTVGLPETLLIAVDGVMQEPGSAFTISGSNIVFTSAPATNATFWGVELGDVGGIAQQAVTQSASNNSTSIATTAYVDTLKLDDLATPDDNTDLNVSTTRHGLVPKITSASNFLKGDGTWAAAGAIDVSGTPVNNQLAVWTDADTLEGEADLTYSGTVLTVTGQTWVAYPSSGIAATFKQVSGAGTAANGYLVFKDENDANVFYIGKDGSDGSVAWHNESNANMRFGTNGATKMTLTAAGNLEIANGNLKVAASKGIDFSAQTQSTSTTDSELLDHYEEGTWTPVVKDVSGDAAGHGTQAGRYTRIGNMVYVSGHVVLNSISGMTGADQASITGLPFTSENVSGMSYSGGVGFAGDLDSWTAGFSVAPIVRPNTTKIDLQVWSSANGISNMSVTQVSANGDIHFSVTYRT